MKSMYLKIFTILVFLTGFTNLSAQDFYLNANGVTCMCPAANVGDSGVVNGVTYTKRTREQITEGNASTTCTSGITNMNALFNDWVDFNGDISTYDVSDVVTMSETFQNAQLFNIDISYWDVSNVINMYGTFTDAYSFNIDIGNWDISNVTSMNTMFLHANSFDQNLSNWQFNSNVSIGNFIAHSGLNTNNYDALLETFVNQNILNKYLFSDELTYCNETARDELINNRGWTITDDSYFPSTITAPSNLVVEANPTTCMAIGIDLGTPTIDACVTQSITNNAPIEYPIGDTVVIWTLVDGNGDTHTDTQNISVTLTVDIADVCYVSSDDVEVTKNRIFLFNVDGNNVNYYEVLRETTTGGVYETIGFIIPPANSFLDNSSNNNTQAYRYKVQTLDVCGAMSDESPYHKTILLQSSIAANNTINLSWTPYVGTDYTTYNIFKQINGGTFELFTSLASTNLTYNDIDVDISINSYAYYVSIDVDSCIGTPFMSEAIKSNQDGTIILDVVDVEELKRSIKLFPNPTRSVVSIDLPTDLMLNEVNVINNLGQLVLNSKSKTFNVETLMSGIYYIRIETDKGVFTKNLIKQ